MFDNSKCRPDEHCGKFESYGALFHYCILSKYCNTDGQWTGKDVTFECPSDVDRDTPVV